CKMKRVRVASRCLLASLLISICWAASVSTAPLEAASDLADILRPNEQEDTNVALVTLSASSSSEEDDSSSASKEANASDDLIFLTRKSQSTPTSAPIHSQSQILTKAQVESSASEEELDEEELEAPATPANASLPPIDMSAFVALIPTQQVHAIVSDYYRNDAEVQWVYRFLHSDCFAEKKQLLLQLPEVLAFTRYLNASGLDVLQLAKHILQAIGPPSTELPAAEEDIDYSSACSGATSEQVKGLQGLTDSVLEALPQDQILATFFDKFEADQQFSKLIEGLGTPKFSKILSNLRNSVPLRYEVAELQKCRINIGQIVESLMSYFFLSNF
ncbi:hypothetical protein KR093_007327, partial [Drosophila rubida]